jgi:signal transduction histidine kinase
MELRLSHRLTLVLSLFGVAIAGGALWNHMRELRSALYDREQNLSEAAAEAVKALVESQFQGRAGSRLGKSLEDIVRKTDIAMIVVFDTKGRRLMGRSDDAAQLARVPHPGVSIERVADGVYDVEKNVDLGGGRPGLLEIGFHTAAIEARLHDLNSRAIRFGVMALLTIGLSAWLIGTWFGMRIEKIVPRVEALARGPLDFKPLRGEGAGDEVGRLASAFNRLGATLKSETLRRHELEGEKQELSAMLVHDLKTPLTVIRSGIALLKEQLETSAPAPAAARKRSGRAESGTPARTFELLELSTKRLQRMVEDVLQLAKLEEVAGLRERISVDAAAMIQACAKDFALVAEERGQKIVVKLPREPLPEVRGDGTLLRRVLDNLVHNAVEHTPSGGSITLAASVDASYLRVGVSDSGPGVPPEARADLFRKFFQKDYKRHVGNVGLGLAFCEKVVLRHEGVIGIEDAKPRGACFYFLLPLEQPRLL